MKKTTVTSLLLVAAFALAGVKIAWSVLPQRNDPTISRESSLIPTQEANLTKLVISDDADHVVDLGGTTSLGFCPLILLVRADSSFMDGAVAPTQSNDIWRDGGQLWAIPVSGRGSWHFCRAPSSGTVTLTMKALGAN